MKRIGRSWANYFAKVKKISDIYKKNVKNNNAIQQSFASMATLGNCKKRQRKNKQKGKI